MMPMKLMTAFSNLRNKRESPGHRAETIHHQTCWWAAWTHPGGTHWGQILLNLSLTLIVMRKGGFTPLKMFGLDFVS